MRSLSPINRHPRDVYLRCAARTANPTKRSQLQAAANAVEAAGNDYVACAVATRISQYPTGVINLSPSNSTDIGELYGRVLVSGGERGIYNEIKNLADLALCPHCGIKTVRTLDHFLPQHPFSELVVHPQNLVPCCSDCNHSKGGYYAVQEDRVLFHPYFDSWDHLEFLVARVAYQDGVQVLFEIVNPVGATRVEHERALATFRVFELGKAFAIKAARALPEIKTSCCFVAAYGPQAVRDLLNSHFDSECRKRPTGWKQALYKALRDDAVFYNGGFVNIF